MANNTFNPILQTQEIKRFSTSTPSPAPGRAIVLAGKNQPMLVIRHGEGGGPAFTQLFTGAYKWLYEVDVTEQQLTFDELLQSKDNFLAFRASITLACVANDPAAIVANNITDALRVLRPLIGKMIADLAVQYSLEELEQLRHDLAQQGVAQTSAAGFSIRHFICQLSLTKEAEKIAAARAMQRTEHQRAKEQAVLDGELKDIKAERAVKIIEGGPKRALAEYLAENPSSIMEVAERLAGLQQREQEWQKKQSELLLLADKLDDPDIRNMFIEKVAGKPIHQIGAGTTDANSNDDPIEFDPVVDDDDDLPEEFQRD